MTKKNKIELIIVVIITIINVLILLKAKYARQYIDFKDNFDFDEETYSSQYNGI